MERKMGQRVAVCLILAGLLALSAYIGWRQLKWLLPKGETGGTEQAEEQTPQGQTVEEPFDEIDVEVDVGEIVLQRGERYQCETSWSGADYAMETTVEDGKLTVVSRVQGKLHFNVQGNDGQVKITVPEDAALEDVTLISDLGNVTVDGGDGLKMGEVTLRSGLGNVDLGGITCQELTCTVDMGETALDRLVAEQLEVTADLGGITAREIDAQAVTLCADMGSITFESQCPAEEWCYDLASDMGKITVGGQDHGTKARGGGGSRSLNMTTEMGDIELDFQ